MQSERIKNHIKNPFYAFVHFGMNTFTDREWGTGAEDPRLFCPTKIDAESIAETLKKAGMTGLVLTAKHHDGFCLWPSSTTEHSVKFSPYKDGKGDIVKEFQLACEKTGLRFGIYLSPWDMNSRLYGSDEYNDFYKAQLKEILTGYGELFYVWFDGACASDKKQDYDFEGYYELVRKHQPNACIFSHNGPDVAWIGNENGVCEGETLLNGYIPFEADVSIRNGWFYHENEEPKNADELLKLYENSVLRGFCLNLNVPPTRDGVLDKRDIASLEALGEKLRQKGYIK